MPLFRIVSGAISSELAFFLAFKSLTYECGMLIVVKAVDNFSPFVNVTSILMPMMMIFIYPWLKKLSPV